MGILESIKKAAAETGGNKSKIMYWKSGDKKRIRFLTDMEDGKEIVFHDSFSKNVNVPCQKLFGKKCPYCEDEELRTRPQYVWSVFDYDSEEVKLFMFPVNNFTPVPALVQMYETYGSMIDRDYLITRTGKQKETSYGVVPMDKAKFRNDKAKPFSESSILKILNAAYPPDINSNADEEEENEDDDLPFAVGEEEKSKKKAPEKEDEETKLDYSEMTAKQLYKLCDERGIICEMKKPAKYYIELLEHWDKAETDWA
jgi:hypothetical protein